MEMPRGSTTIFIYIFIRTPEGRKKSTNQQEERRTDPRVYEESKQKKKRTTESTNKICIFAITLPIWPGYTIRCKGY